MPVSDKKFRKFLAGIKGQHSKVQCRDSVIPPGTKGFQKQSDAAMANRCCGVKPPNRPLKKSNQDRKMLLLGALAPLPVQNKSLAGRSERSGIGCSWLLGTFSGLLSHVWTVMIVGDPSTAYRFDAMKY
jgi:hypothetical protein